MTVVPGRNIDRGFALIKEAVAHDNAKKYPEAYERYKKGIELISMGLASETIKGRKENLEGYLEKAKSRMKQLEQVLVAAREKANLKGSESKQSPAPAQPKKDAARQEPRKNAGADGDVEETKPKQAIKQKTSENDALKAAISNVIVRMKPDVKWDDVVGLTTAKEALKEAVILPFKFPQLFQGKREPWRGILLYGCPGTGKSFLAKAVAAECDATFFSVSSSDLVSKYVGESARLIKALFEMARAEKQAVIFIDEIDALASSRGGGEESDASRQIKTEFLVQMQGVGKTGGNVLVLGATNYPESLDSAIRRRFEKRIEVSLPDAAARANIIKNCIGSTPNVLMDEDITELGQQTENYSGSDLSILCKEALMDPVRILQKVSYFRLNKITGMYEVSSSDMPGAEKKDFMDIPNDKLTVPYVTLSSLLRAKASVKSSVSQADQVRIANFTKEFGSS